MKIFGWMQKRLHQNVVKDTLSKNVKIIESIAIDNNTKDLIEQVALIDVLEGWRDGVLTIGTFGFDRLKPLLDENNYHFISESEEDNDYEDDIFSDNVDTDNDDEEEVNPLIFTTFEDNFGNVSGENKNDIIDDEIERAQVGPNVEIIEIEEGPKARTTLAELFMADSSYDVIKNKDIKSKLIKFERDASKKSSFTRTKNNSLSFAKKFVPHVGENSHPVKKLNQMMKKMLKRKIHPTIETFIDNSKSIDVEVVEESISLL